MKKKKLINNKLNVFAATVFLGEHFEDSLMPARPKSGLLLLCTYSAAVCCRLVIFSEEKPKEEEEEEEPLTEKDEEERRIAEMGRPMLGDHVKLEVIIEESYEFKVKQLECVCLVT